MVWPRVVMLYSIIGGAPGGGSIGTARPAGHKGVGRKCNNPVLGTVYRVPGCVACGGRSVAEDGVEHPADGEEAEGGHDRGAELPAVGRGRDADPAGDPRAGFEPGLAPLTDAH